MGRVKGWLLAHLPAGLLARPAEWFLAILCLLSGPPILLGRSTPRAVHSLLPPVIYSIWGGALVLGGLGLVCGLSSYRRSPAGWTVTRVPCYRMGLRVLGLSATLYAATGLIVGRWDALPFAAITLSFAGMCAVRLLTLGARV